MDVWATGGVIGRIALASAGGEKPTTDFSDFGADVVVRPRS